VGSYTDYADFDVVPMEACSLLLGPPWEYDKYAARHGRTNSYTFMHKNKNITFLLLSPVDDRKHCKEVVVNNIKQPAMSDSSIDKHEGIK
jgi:hypothetical protein